MLSKFSAPYVSRDILVLAVSGGVDSMVLLDLIMKSHPRDCMIVAHFDHSLRGEESDGDSDFVAEFCKRENLIFTVEKMDILTLSKNEKMSIESTARKYRYASLMSVAEKYQAKYILTAHHLDDRIETALFNLIRGSKLGGIHAIREFAVRSSQTATLSYEGGYSSVCWEDGDTLSWRCEQYRYDLSAQSTASWYSSEICRDQSWISSSDRELHQLYRRAQGLDRWGDTHFPQGWIELLGSWFRAKIPILPEGDHQIPLRMSQLWYHMTLRRQYRGDTPLYIDREWGNREASEGIENAETEGDDHSLLEDDFPRSRIILGSLSYAFLSLSGVWVERCHFEFVLYSSGANIFFSTSIFEEFIQSAYSWAFPSSTHLNDRNANPSYRTDPGSIVIGFPDNLLIAQPNWLRYFGFFVISATAGYICLRLSLVGLFGSVSLMLANRFSNHCNCSGFSIACLHADRYWGISGVVATTRSAICWGDICISAHDRACMDPKLSKVFNNQRASFWLSCEEAFSALIAASLEAIILSFSHHFGFLFPTISSSAGLGLPTCLRALS